MTDDRPITEQAAERLSLLGHLIKEAEDKEAERAAEILRHLADAEHTKTVMARLDDPTIPRSMAKPSEPDPDLAAYKIEAKGTERE